MADNFETRFPRINREKGTVSVSAPRKNGVPESADQKTIQFLKLAQSRYRTAADSETELRREQEIDQRFASSEQWPDGIKADRLLDGRPCLTINRLPAFKRQVTNQQRAAKPAIQISPIDSQKDKKTAEVLQGIIRHIESQSSADVAYDTACDHQVTIGRGYVKLVVEWDDMDPWVQCIRIRRVRNPFLIYFDPACQEHDYSDARYAFEVEDVPKEEFRELWGQGALDLAQPFDAQMDRSNDMMPEGRIRMATYWYVEQTEEEVVLLSNGEEFPAAAMEDEEMIAFLNDTGVTEQRRRKVQRKKVKWAKITGNQILSEGEWAGRWIPIIPVLGDELDINGKLDLRGMIRDARDPQRMYNYWATAQTEAIALAPKAPVVAAEGQLEGDMLSQWKLANRRNIPVLTYKPKTLAGLLVPPPQRQVVEPPIVAISTALAQSDNDLKAVTGLYDASLGERGPEESARAILSRQRQGEISNSHWVDNLIRAMRALGRQLVDLIPRVYDVPRVMRIIGADNQPVTVMVHAGADPSQLPATDADAMQGIQGIYDLSAGRYDVVATVGPTYSSRRQEAVTAMTEFIKAFPQAAPVIGDVMAENMDWPGASIVAQRLRKMVPPNVLEEKSPEQLEAQLMQAQQQMQMMQSEMMEMKMTIEAKQLEMQSRERIEAMRVQAQMQTAQFEAELATKQHREDSMTEVNTEAAKTQLKLQSEAESARIKIAAAHDAEIAKGQATAVSKQYETQHETIENARGRVHETIENQKDRDHEVHLKTMDNAVKVMQQREQAKVQTTQQKEQTKAQITLQKQKTAADLQKAKIAAKAKPKPAPKAKK